MADAARKTYAETQIKKINEKIAKIEGKDRDAVRKRARLASSCLKWLRHSYKTA